MATNKNKKGKKQKRKTRRRGGRTALSSPWIHREGKLGGPGYTEKSERERHRLLSVAVDKFGYRSTLGSLQVLLRGHGMRAKKQHVIEQDKDWLVSKFGGEGSFGG